MADAGDALVLVQRDGHVGVVLLNRPKQLNALSGELMAALAAALEELDADPEIRAIVLGGSERAFAAGADIGELAAGTPVSLYENRRLDRWDAIRDVRTPIVAAVSGFCLGGGCELAMLCDLIVASESAKFGQPEINLGVLPGAGGTQRLTRAVGKAVAMDMILTGRMLSAREALDFGLVARVVAEGDVARRGEARRARDRREGTGRRPAREGGGRPGVRGAAHGGCRVRTAHVPRGARVGGRRRGTAGVRREAAPRLQGTVDSPAWPRSKSVATAQSRPSRSTVRRSSTRSTARCTPGLRDALKQARDPEIRAVVVTGAGKGSAPARTSRSSREGGDVSDALRATYHPNVLAIRALEKPVIAAVNGACAGAGLSFACACDIRIASDAASFVPGFVGIGLVPDAGGTYFLHRLLGAPRAFEWMSSNRRLTAAEAHAWGLVSEVVEADALAARAAELAAFYAGSADAGRSA